MGRDKVSEMAVGKNKRLTKSSKKGRVFNVCLADLKKDEEQAHRIVKLRVEDVQDRRVLTNFYGIQLTTDKLRSLVRKWQTLIEANVDAKTSDGYTLRLFCIGFTKKRSNQLKKTCYCTSQQGKNIRRKMTDIMTRETSSVDLKDLVQKLIPEVIGKEIEKACHGIYPLQNVYIRKVKILRKPKLDVVKLMELHGDAKEDAGKVVVEAVGSDFQAGGPTL